VLNRFEMKNFYLILILVFISFLSKTAFGINEIPYEERYKMLPGYKIFHYPPIPWSENKREFNCQERKKFGDWGEPFGCYCDNPTLYFYPEGAANSDGSRSLCMDPAEWSKKWDEQLRPVRMANEKKRLEEEALRREEDAKRMAAKKQADRDYAIYKAEAEKRAEQEYWKNLCEEYRHARKQCSLNFHLIDGCVRVQLEGPGRPTFENIRDRCRL